MYNDNNIKKGVCCIFITKKNRTQKMKFIYLGMSDGVSKTIKGKKIVERNIFSFELHSLLLSYSEPL